MTESWKSSTQNTPKTGFKQLHLQHTPYFSVPQAFILSSGGLTSDFLMLGLGSIKANQEIQKKTPEI